MDTKKLLLMLLILTLVFSFVACGSDTNNAGTIKDGVYTGKGIGNGGDIEVEVTIKDSAITQIDVLSHKETEGYEVAMSELTDLIVQTNSIDQDSVTGCTNTSNGFLEAVHNALTEAGIDPANLESIDAKEETAKIDVEETYDVVVIGGGGAGMTAAIEAAQNGASVVLLEKMPLVGGNTLISGAEMAVANHPIQEHLGIEDSNELHIKDTIEGGDNISDVDLVTTMVEHALEDSRWLIDEIGVEFLEEDLMHFGGHSVARSLIPVEANGRDMVAKLKAKVESLDIPILLETKATELVMDGEKVVGVTAESKDSNYTFKANNGVIIATGGFGSNVEMRVKYNPSVGEEIGSTNTVGTTGDGITIAESVGAELVDMKEIQTYPICDPDHGTLLLYDDCRLYGHTMIVNKEGRRFVEELGRRDEMSFAIVDQTDSVCYELLDEKGYLASNLDKNHQEEQEYLFREGLLVKADTLEEVAEAHGVNVENFLDEVEKFNSYVRNGNDPDFNKRVLTEPIENPPYYLLKAAPGVHHTMGGIKINTNSEVINKEGNIIPGLYAAGEVTGGIHGANRLGSNAITDIIVFGRIAGQNAANNK